MCSRRGTDNSAIGIASDPLRSTPTGCSAGGQAAPWPRSCAATRAATQAPGPDPQLGALKTALEPGIIIAVFHAGQAWPGLTYAFLRYDPEREARVRSVCIHIPIAAVVTVAT